MLEEEEIASVIQDVFRHSKYLTAKAILQVVSRRLADALGEKDSEFDRVKFLNSCGFVQPEKKEVDKAGESQ